MFLVEELICQFTQRYFGNDARCVLKIILVRQNIRKRELIRKLKKFSEDHLNLILCILIHHKLIHISEDETLFVPLTAVLFRDLSQRAWTQLILLDSSFTKLEIRTFMASVILANGAMTPVEILEKTFKFVKDPAKKSLIYEQLTYFAKTGLIGCQGKSDFDQFPLRAAFFNKRQKNPSFFGSLYESNLRELQCAINIFTRDSHDELKPDINKKSLDSLWTVNSQFINTLICLDSIHKYISYEISSTAGDAMKCLILASLCQSNDALFDYKMKKVGMTQILRISNEIYGLNCFPNRNALQRAIDGLTQIPYKYVVADYVNDVYIPEIDRLLTDMTRNICSSLVGMRISNRAKGVFDVLSRFSCKLYSQQLLEEILNLDDNVITGELMFLFREGLLTLRKDPSESPLDAGNCLFMVNLEYSTRGCIQILLDYLQSLLNERKQFIDSVKISKDKYDLAVSLQTQMIVEDPSEDQFLDYMPPEDMDRLEKGRQMLNKMTCMELSLVANLSILGEYLEMCALRRYYSCDSVVEQLNKIYC